MDITDTLAPNSDQLDAIELVAGPRIFTITSVTKNAGDQPIDVHLAEFPRPWRPGKSMRRVLAACWGTDARLWVGRRVELFFDPEVTFGKDKPGGTRISRLSDIPKRKSIPLLVARGKSAMYVVEPLPDAPPSSGMDEFNADTTHWRDPGPLITPAQSKRLFAALNDAGLGDKAAALTFISGQIGREIETSKELTTDQAAAVIDALDAMLADPADTDAPTLDGGTA